MQTSNDVMQSLSGVAQTSSNAA